MKFRSFSNMQIALALSVAVHAVLLTVRFVDPESFNRVFRDTPLEVVLVNARTNERPDVARAIAQAAMAGGGEAALGMATSPLPPSALTQTGDAAEDTRRKLDALQKQQTVLLTQVKAALASMPPPDPKNTTNDAELQAREEKRRQLVKLLAQIERRINEENARPRKRYISPSTQEAAYAVYYDRLRSKIEDHGTENFPESKGRKLYGELTMIVTVDHRGRVLATELAESSGNRTLDRRAEAIARAAGPFGNFSAAMRQQADQIVVVARFKFNRDATLETRLSKPQ